ncbi:MAG: AMP-binding protein [Chloroflexi bacterium]|nr:AMP-binding protein [Chloroflexota bacterium]
MTAAGRAATRTASGPSAPLRVAQHARFARTIDLCFRAHPYYQRVFHELGLRREHLRTVEDLTRLPLTPKAAWMADPEAFRLRLDDVEDVRVEERTLSTVVYTTGSTARPTPMYDTVHDQLSRIDQLARSTTIGGITPDDIVMNLFPLTSIPHQGFLSAQWGTFGVGAAAVAGLTGRPYPDFPIHRHLDDAVERAARTRATVLWGIATYVRKLVMRAEELGADLSAVRLVYAMGEACPPGMRDDVRARLARLGATGVRVLSGYGFTEMQGPALECDELSGFHLATPERYLVEVVDPETHAARPDGQPGLIVLSHLDRRGTLLLRYLVGDVCAFSHEPCPHCGRTEPRFTTSPYRVGHLVKVKGTLVNPAAIQEALSELQSRGLEEYQLALVKETPADPYSQDVLLVRATCAASIGAQMASDVCSQVVQVAEITPQVEIHPLGSFSDAVQSYKFKRFVDERS